MGFMSPELLVPGRSDPKNVKPTPKSDVYAFGLVILQVLTGEIPFRDLGMWEAASKAIEGLRIAKPNNALAIGFSETLWAFVNRCWDTDMRLRPNAVEVVKCLDEVKTSWNGRAMPPCPRVAVAASPLQDTTAELKIGRAIFKEPSNIAEGGTTISQLTSPASDPVSSSTQCTEPPQQLEVTSPVLKPQASKEPTDEVYPHLNKSYKPPPSLLPRKRWSSFKSLKQRFRRFLGLLPHS